MKRQLRWLLGVLLGVGAGAWFGLGQYTAQTRETALMAQQRDELRAELLLLRNHVAQSDVQGKLDLQARASLQAEAMRLDAQSRDLRKKVAFYERLVGENIVERGVAADRVTIAVTAPQRYRVNVLLTQAKRDPATVKGYLRVQVRGVLGGQQREHDIRQLVPFGFRFFQDVAVDVELPPGFVPVELVLRGASSKRVRAKPMFETAVAWLEGSTEMLPGAPSEPVG